MILSKNEYIYKRKLIFQTRECNFDDLTKYINTALKQINKLKADNALNVEVMTEMSQITLVEVIVVISGFFWHLDYDVSYFLSGV